MGSWKRLVALVVAISPLAVASAPSLAEALQPPAAAAPRPGGPPPAGTFVVHAIDVGTGLAILVEGHDFTLLYDAGSNDDIARGADNRVVAYLHAVRPDLTIIDHLILSHPHKDHSELMPDVLAAYQVRNLWDSGALNRICSYRNLLAGVRAEPGIVYHDALGGGANHDAAFLAQSCYGRPLPAATISVPRGPRIVQGAAIALGAGARMTFLHADGSPQSSFNENSLVVRLDLGGRRILLPGDAEAGGRNPPSTPPSPRSIEGELIACCAADVRADILVAGHHGSMTSSRTAFLNAIGASHYVVSGGPTRYGSVTLPDAIVVAEFARRGAVWRTDLNDATCGTNRAKIGRDNDGRAGGCDNVTIRIDAAGTIAAGYNRRAD
jgi:beta-lactamase superfamily II metal-dependent hydrolase